jgi:D-alanyl-D-alanine carboxypeptidase/D-alanyl-D-alanine-endopeptidase (penicillin-binding protein 4)
VSTFLRFSTGLTAATAVSLTLFVGPALAAPSPSPSPSATSVPSVAPSSSPSTSQSATPAPTPIRVPPTGPFPACSAAKALASQALGKLYAYVINADTGKVLVDLRGQETTPSASVLKVLTASAAIVALPSTYKAVTKVFNVPSEPGTIVLQGGGDHTLSRMTGDSYTTYYKPARLETLAAQVAAKWDVTQPITKIILDSSFFSGPSYNPFWKASDRTNGYVSNITGLEVDSDRANPDLTSAAYSGYRSTNSTLTTGKYFKASLEGLADSAQLVEGKTPSGAVEITRVNSQPITTWLAHAIAVSDNTETEYIGRHAAKAVGLPASFDSIQQLVKQTLNPLGIDTTGLVMKDASGLAQADRVSAKMIAGLMEKVANNQGGLGSLEGYLPVAGKTGTLAGRFNGPNAIAKQFVKGKSGYIPGLYSLAGIIDAKDGSRLAYAMFARSSGSNRVGYEARPALDTAATRFYECGGGLTR